MQNQLLPRRIVQTQGRLPVLFAEAGDETLCQRDYIFLPFTQRGNFKMDGVDAVEQVFTEFSFVRHFGQVAVGGADKADIYGNRRIAAHPHDAAALDGGQQFGLQVIGEIAYFIEEERAVVGNLELSGTVGMGIGERPLYMAEKLAFKKAFGNGAHVHAYHFLAVACGEGMYLAGKHLFTRAVLAGDEDVGIGGRYLFYQHAKLLHDAAFSPVHGRSGACRRSCRFLPGCRGVLCGI